MKKSFKQILAMLLAAVMMMSLAACGGSGSTEQAEENNVQNEASQTNDAATSEDVTIRITWWGGQTRHEYTQEPLNLYTELNPHAYFEATPSGWDGYFEKLATDTATGGMPDIVQMDYLYISTYANNNSLADLTPYIENGTIDTSNIEEFIVNTGLEIPTSDWTWDDFVNMAQTIYDKTGNVGCSSGPVEDVNIFNYWVSSLGLEGGPMATDDTGFHFNWNNYTMILSVSPFWICLLWTSWMLWAWVTASLAPQRSPLST